jgi:hypothetical protein
MRHLLSDFEQCRFRYSPDLRRQAFRETWSGTGDTVRSDRPSPRIPGARKFCDEHPACRPDCTTGICSRSFSTWTAACPANAAFAGNRDTASRSGAQSLPVEAHLAQPVRRSLPGVGVPGTRYSVGPIQHGASVRARWLVGQNATSRIAAHRMTGNQLQMGPDQHETGTSVQVQTLHRAPAPGLRCSNTPMLLRAFALRLEVQRSPGRLPVPISPAFPSLAAVLLPSARRTLRTRRPPRERSRWDSYWRIYSTLLRDPLTVVKCFRHNRIRGLRFFLRSGRDTLILIPTSGRER